MVTITCTCTTCTDNAQRLGKTTLSVDMPQAAVTVLGKITPKVAHRLVWQANDPTLGHILCARYGWTVA